jgi:hypothetical protein
MTNAAAVRLEDAGHLRGDDHHPEGSAVLPL